MTAKEYLSQIHDLDERISILIQERDALKSRALCNQSPQMDANKVSSSYSASDEGKVVSNGALVAQTARASEITQNGTYDTILNNEVIVNVSGGGSVANVLEGFEEPSQNEGDIGDFYLYKHKSGVASNGNAYLDTGIKASGDVEFEVEYYTKNTLSSANYGTIFGGRDSSGVKEYMLSTYTPNNSYKGIFGYRDQRYSAKITSKTRETISFKNGVLTCPDGSTLNINTYEWESTDNIYIFGLRSGSSNVQSGIVEIFGFKMWKNGILVRDYIPYEQNGSVGLYDNVNNTFTAPSAGTLVYSNLSIIKVYKKTSAGWSIYIDENHWENL